MSSLKTLKEISYSKKTIIFIIAGASFVFIIGKSIMETYDNEVEKLKNKQNINIEKKVEIKDRSLFDIDQTTALKNKINEIKDEVTIKLNETKEKNEELNKQIEENQKIIENQQKDLIALKSINSNEEKIANEKVAQEMNDIRKSLEKTNIELERLRKEKEMKEKIDGELKLPPLNGALSEAISTKENSTKEKKEDKEIKFPPEAKKVTEKGFFKFQKTGVSKEETSPIKEEPKKEENKMDLMMGLVDAIMVTGVDAPTNIGTKNSDAKDPLPVLLSVNSETVIANNQFQEYKDCFILGTATGNATTERAYIRLSKMSCVSKNGEKRIETDIEGWVYGEDNKVGVSGHLVTKSGTLILKGLMAGILQGIADSTAKSDNYFNNGNNGSYSSNNNRDIGRDAAGGVGKGVGSAFKTLADFYIDMAKDLYPVIEVKGGREVQILVKGGKQITEAPYNKLFVNTEFEMNLNKNISIDY